MTPEVLAAIARLEERTAMPMAKSIGSIPVSCADIATLITAYREAERDAARWLHVSRKGPIDMQIYDAKLGVMTLWGEDADRHVDEGIARAAIAKGGSHAG